MNGSAAVFALLGGLTLFFPEELVASSGLDVRAEPLVQLLAGGLFAIAGLNWMGRGAIYGGIYGRPIVFANISFGTITTATLFSALSDGSFGPWGWALMVPFVVHALGFAKLMRSPPWPASRQSAD